MWSVAGDPLTNPKAMVIFGERPGADIRRAIKSSWHRPRLSIAGHPPDEPWILTCWCSEMPCFDSAIAAAIDRVADFSHWIGRECLECMRVRSIT
jgi:Fe-S-cluster-containing hydrogenase component 2